MGTRPWFVVALLATQSCGFNECKWADAGTTAVPAFRTGWCMSRMWPLWVTPN